MRLILEIDNMYCFFLDATSIALGVVGGLALAARASPSFPNTRKGLVKALEELSSCQIPEPTQEIQAIPLLVGGCHAYAFLLATISALATGSSVVPTSRDISVQSIVSVAWIGVTISSTWLLIKFFYTIIWLTPKAMWLAFACLAQDLALLAASK